MHWRIPQADIDRFRDSCLEAMSSLQPVEHRIGRCFWFDLLVLTRRYHIAIDEVLQPVLNLEMGEPPTGIKPATPFTRAPLKGLWHKHWFSARFLPANILAVTQRKGAMDWIWDVANEGDQLTEELVNQITHRMTVGAFESRHAAKQITGEWIIFLPHDGHNYYLCLGTHETGDDRLAEKINTLCKMDYPDVAEWIALAVIELEKQR